ncbi:MAG: acyl-ACP--UDP-N-acetylglucosamine O-acyltransferase [Candidatus Marinimicrobia bacterium]|nr:acyl-ACP--UDP-N-acetylglucosamine O-acyltransferase [Candidatus Neomarinimicrobiota bacterium]MBT3763891.1 acyl-ACP--UDP-N-acetylglucosamine O-acyltransferase [Candidatus Neomarinimicrobiota bacterium]MBT6129705.1 acyl-ACP--UDP-N-acetylglucosamine O-acyltransferase [Candidatus Neomarinimicrobiota bacterium]MBT6636986.1 acyl-ACP--UDP-N-acetylglucosamine O-acyltransferase [Candidatus Neomarinimicrobiota bacterium]MBT6842033.1 acyl-ACP--UDP-N-acetylglucosamine O-acyltransferase [Candidatus Neom
MHSTAIISPRANLGQNVSVGAYTIIEDNVVIGDGTSIGNHNTICTGTIVGSDCTIYHNCSIGEAPQDLKYAGEDTKTIIGNNVLIRESVTINRGTIAYGKTEIGDNVLLMACAHIAHDCIIGDNTIMANLATLGGHVELGDWVNLGGGVMVHQFTKVGSQSFIGGGFRVVQDVPPFIITAGEPLRFTGINKIGLQRRGFSDETRMLIKKAYRTYFMSRMNRTDALNKIKAELPVTNEIKIIIKFIESSERGII